ncbi:YihY family protein [Fusobacterium necrophorum subsp. funduliforme 1_1_36S]|nr:YihY family protein [Fusobacterium necrophorum subsp. funduliforme 1_1_36S]
MALFMVMPNTEVKWLPAFIASFFTSIMFSVFQYAFIYLQVLINTYNKIYGSFSVIFIFLIWLRIAWFLIILGAHLSYLLQNRDMNLYYDSLNIDEISFQSKFSLAVHILTEMVIRYQKEENLVTRADFIEKFHNVIAIDGVLRILKKGNFILEGKNEKQEKVYSLAKNLEKTKLEEVYFVISSYGKKLENIEYKVVSEKNLQTRLSELGGYEERE